MATTWVADSRVYDSRKEVLHEYICDLQVLFTFVKLLNTCILCIEISVVSTRNHLIIRYCKDNPQQRPVYSFFYLIQRTKFSILLL